MLNRDDNVRYGLPLTLTLALAALVVIVAGIRAGADLIIPILLGLFIAVICTSPVNWLHRLGLGLRLAVVVTLLVIGGFLSLVGLLVVNAFGTFIEALPGIEGRLYEHYLNLLDSLAAMGLAINPDTLAGLVEPEDEGGWLTALLGGLGNLLMQSVVVALLVIFMLFETLNFRRKVAHALDHPEASLQRFQEFSQTLKRYLAVKTFVSLLTGLMAWLACLVAGVDFPLLWGVLAFALNYIPNIGSAIAALPPVLLLLVSQDGGLFQAFGLAMAYLAINFVLGNLVEPRLMGRALGLSAFVAFLSLVVWGWMLGVVGMLLSVVLTMTLKIALDSHPQTRWIAYLLGPGKRPMADRVMVEEGGKASLSGDEAEIPRTETQSPRQEPGREER
ncbi:MAG: AI-2E family transporter [Halomonas sp.]|jgi:predicted PurR-regulated permease PerM|uniref:AI-2E family transporter n=1 Tax=Billgrantia tianxiuensis TaxID=2497861 RepID=A0A6I6ST03_9GAMM|nr:MULTISPECIES: AI-2E family transporter [Halomonas]MCE8036023.1 AI-2E family transporter [Halomonas sp. MCCC 1A11057]MDX5435045.1 AI-2E family transporter [Halomonas sp.]QHC50785.1 AI-2E family transporter [Halomonas tianxiuensis]